MPAPTIELRHVSELVPYAKNSRRHSAAQVEQIAKSLREFGMVGAIVVRDMTIAKGHGTLSAIKTIYDRGWMLYPAPGAAAGAEPYPAGKVPIIDCTGWTDEQFKAFVIADNQLALNADWDMDLLPVEVIDLSTSDFDLSILGFDDAELAALLEGAEEMPSADDGEPPVESEDERVKMTFKLTPDQADQVRFALKAAGKLGPYIEPENDSDEANALARVCELFVTQNGG